MKTEHKVIAGSILLGLLNWLADAVLDSFIFSGKPFLGSLLLDVSGHELFMRSAGLIALVAFGVVLSKVVGKLKEAKAALDDRCETVRAVTDTARDAIVMMDHKGSVSYWNPAAELMFGYPKEEVLGRVLHSLLVPSRYMDDYEAGFAKFRETGQGVAVGKTLELTALKKDGEEFPVELSLSANKVGGQWHSIAIIRDITERKRAEEDLRASRWELEAMVDERTAELTEANQQLQDEVSEKKRAEEALKGSERFFGTIFDSIRDPFSIIDSDYKVVRVNEAYAQMKGMPAQSLIGKKCFEVLYGRSIVCDGCIVEKTFSSGDPCAKDKLVSLPDGVETWVDIFTYPIFGSDLRVSHVIEYTRDITDRKRGEREKKRLIEKLEYFSTIDSLTGLLNRRALLERLNNESERAKRYGSELSIVLCDLDGFKEVNDIYGHGVGDEVLKLVAGALTKPLRKADAAGRYGGDEFMLVLPETSIEGAEVLAERIRSAIESSELLVSNGRAIKVSLSFGVTDFGSLGGTRGDIDTLIRNADIALYDSKQSGKNKVHVIKG